MLAIVGRDYVRTAWWTPAFEAIIDRYSTNKAYQKYDLLAELRARGLFTVTNTRRTHPADFEQSVEHLVEAFHLRNGFSRDRMTVDAARNFDTEATNHLASFAEAGVMNLGVQASVTWWRPNARRGEDDKR